MSTLIKLLVLLTIPLVVGFSWLALSQNPQLQMKQNSLFPTVTFALSRWSANPPYYSISVDSTGNATYQSTPNSDQETGNPYTVEFVASNSIRQKVFQITEDLHFFKGALKDNDTHVGDSGIRTLTFSDGKLQNQINYHSSANPLIQQLTVIFQNISTTLEFGHQLSNMHQHNNVGIDNELTRMQQMAQEGRLVELQAVVPVLQAIASDPSASTASRQRAQAIVKGAASVFGAASSSRQ